MTTPGYLPSGSVGAPGGGIQMFPRRTAPSDEVKDTDRTVPPVRCSHSLTVRKASAACEPGASVVMPPWMCPGPLLICCPS